MKNYKNLKEFYTQKYVQMLPYFKEQKTRAFLNLTLTLIGVSFFGIFAISPTLSTISQLKKQLEDSRLVNQKLDQKITNLDLLQKQYALLEPDLPVVFSAIPEDPTVPLLLAQLNALAVNSGVSIVSLQSQQVELTKPEETEKAHSSFIFALEISGTHDNAMSFLSSLINFERIVTINSFSVTKTEEGLDQLQINGIAYFKK